MNCGGSASREHRMRAQHHSSRESTIGVPVRRACHRQDVLSSRRSHRKALLQDGWPEGDTYSICTVFVMALSDTPIRYSLLAALCNALIRKQGMGYMCIEWAWIAPSAPGPLQVAAWILYRDALHEHPASYARFMANKQAMKATHIILPLSTTPMLTPTRWGGPTATPWPQLTMAMQH